MQRNGSSAAFEKALELLNDAASLYTDSWVELSTPCLEGGKREVGEPLEDEAIPESQGRVVPYLLVEADGTNIALQREEARRAEVKVGIAHEGWKK